MLTVITGFTVAHTLTLALASLEIVSLPARLVESAIAASIVYVAAENRWRHADASHRWKVAFGFGLVHGFGFAAVRRELGLPAEGLMRSLLAFNLGVELGKLAIALVCWPLLLWIGRRSWAMRLCIAISSVRLAFGAAWLVGGRLRSASCRFDFLAGQENQGSHGYFRASGFRFSRWAEWNSFASSLM